MKTKVSRESLASRIFVLLLVAFVVIFTLSPQIGGDSTQTRDKADVPAAKAMNAPAAQVELSCGSFDSNTQELQAVIVKDDLAKLASFAALRRADLRGSSCPAEIAAWAAAHPNIDVQYTVELPNGKTLTNSDTAVDLSGISAEQYEKTMELLALLPQAEKFELGNIAAGSTGFSGEQLMTLFAAYPDASFNYSFSIAGQTVDESTTALDLSTASSEEICSAAPLLARAGSIQTINMGSENGNVSIEDVGLVQSCCPEALIDYRFTLFGKEFSTQDTEMNFWHVEMNDGGAAVRSVMPFMKNCSYVDMDSCGISNEDMLALRADFPNTKFVWRIWFGDNYSVRTDVERILASKPSVGGMIDDGDVLALSCCTDMRFLDLGHNTELSDISFVSNMPKLEVLIVAMCNISDLSPLANCYNLEYLEIQTQNAPLYDLSPLSGLITLHHLNIGELQSLTDISPLYGLTELERLWITSLTPVPREQVDTMRACVPNCNVNNTAGDPHGDSWRFYRYDPAIPKYWWVERHELLREQLGYNYQEYAFYWLDPLSGMEAPAQYRGMFGKM